MASPPDKNKVKKNDPTENKGPVPYGPGPPGGGGLRQETINELETFKKRIKEIDQERSLAQPKPSIYILFSGSYTNGRSWCEVCKAVHDYICKDIIPKVTKTGYLLWVQVGSQPEWMRAENPFKMDPLTKLKMIPTLIEWGTEKKLQGLELQNPPLVKEVFGLDP